MKIDSVIFDLDGTLWDSTETVRESWGFSLERNFGVENYLSREDIAGIMGLTEKEIADRLFARFGERCYQVCRCCISEEPAYIALHGGRLYKGTEAMLCSLARCFPLFIVSNCQDGYIESFLSYTGLGRYFLDFECEGRTGLKKAENIALLIARRGLEHPVYVGDTALDAKSAAQARCPFIHASYGFGSVEEPLGRVNSPEELPALIEKLMEEKNV